MKRNGTRLALLAVLLVVVAFLEFRQSPQLGYLLFFRGAGQLDGKIIRKRLIFREGVPEGVHADDGQISGVLDNNKANSRSGTSKKVAAVTARPATRTDRRNDI